MQGTYDSSLVLLSVAVAVIASYTALDLAGRVTAARERAATLWLIGGAFAMGIGIWSMHFIGMLAFSLGVPVAYDRALTLLSMAIGIIVSGFALFMTTRSTLRTRNLMVGGVLMGLGISAMHYTGMAAMQMFPPIRYDRLLVAASVAIAIGASLAAIFIVFRLRAGEYSWERFFWKLASALVMGVAIAGMHYTAMAAASFAPGSVCVVAGSVNSSWLATWVAATSLGILGITLLLSMFDARLAARTAGLVDSLRRANEELRHLALHDPLTRLPNRTLLEDRVAQAIALARRHGVSLAVIYVDLDRFKSINDSLGHHVGDALLREVACRLAGCVRETDTVARIGGDEFVILLSELGSVEESAKAAERILESFSMAFHLDERELRLSASIGVSQFPQHGEDVHRLMVNADAAMYHAKTMGRNNVRFYAPGMNSFAQERLTLENDLRRALERGEFELHYQPKIRVVGASLSGMEALIRWRHPHRGLVSPGDFIPIAEDCGLIIPLGEWVLRTACRQNALWQRAGLPPLPVAVNLSGRHFLRRGLLAMISRTLAGTGLDPGFLEIELTESAVMQNPDARRRVRATAAPPRRLARGIAPRVRSPRAGRRDRRGSPGCGAGRLQRSRPHLSTPAGPAGGVRAERLPSRGFCRADGASAFAPGKALPWGGLRSVESERRPGAAPRAREDAATPGRSAPRPEMPSLIGNQEPELRTRNA